MTARDPKLGELAPTAVFHGALSAALKGIGLSETQLFIVLTEVESLAGDIIAERDALREHARALAEALRTLDASLKWEEQRSGTTYHGDEAARAALAAWDAAQRGGDK
jgi:hypothetical protein